jgi:anti-sigma factor RsiW
MSCKNVQSEFSELLFAPEAKTSASLRAHLAACEGCAAEFAALKRTVALLDGWQAPEPSAYFDQKLAVRLREEQAKPAAGWLERLRERVLFNTGRQFRPALAGAMALVLVLGGGGYAGLSGFQQTRPQALSATVNDLQILDKNDQAIQQMDQLLQEDDSGDSAPVGQPAS